MKKYMPLEGLRWSRDSGSALCDTSQNSRSRTGWGGILLCITFLLRNKSEFFFPYYQIAYRLLMMPLACVVLMLIKSEKIEAVLSWFGKYSLEIYVLQMLMIGMVDTVLKAVGFQSDHYSAWLTLLTFGIILAVCMPVHKGIDRITKNK